MFIFWKNKNLILNATSSIDNRSYRQHEALKFKFIDIIKPVVMGVSLGKWFETTKHKVFYSPLKHITKE